MNLQNHFAAYCIDGPINASVLRTALCIRCSAQMKSSVATLTDVSRGSSESFDSALLRFPSRRLPARQQGIVASRRCQLPALRDCSDQAAPPTAVGRSLLSETGTHKIRSDISHRRHPIRYSTGSPSNDKTRFKAGEGAAGENGFLLLPVISCYYNIYTTVSSSEVLTSLLFWTLQRSLTRAELARRESSRLYEGN